MKKIFIPFLISIVLILIGFGLFRPLEVYFEELIQSQNDHTGLYSLFSFLILTSDIVLPVPSSIVMFTNGFVLGMISGTALSLVSSITGSVIGYYLGRYTSMGFRSGENQKAESFLDRYGSSAILVSRGIPIISESVSITLGFNKMPFRKYLLHNIIGYIPVCALYGWFGSLGYNRNTFLLSFLCSLVIATIFWFAGKNIRVKAKSMIQDKNYHT